MSQKCHACVSLLTGHAAPLGSLADGVTQLGDRLGGEEGRQGFQAARHVLVDAAAVLHHAVVTYAGTQHGVPGPVLQQQVIPPDVNHSWNMLVPATAARLPHSLPRRPHPHQTRAGPNVGLRVRFILFLNIP